MDQTVIKEYTNGEVTVVWEPSKCIHSGICLKGLPEVFDLKKRPWVNMQATNSERIVQTVRECPSKALSIKGIRFKETHSADTDITLIPGGPMIVKGGATVHHRKNTEVIDSTVSFCRCSRSKNFPYCDGTHAQPKEN